MKIKFKVKKSIRFGGWSLSPDENMECELPQLISGPSAVADLLKRYPDVIEMESTETEDNGQVDEIPEVPETEPETPVEEPKDEVPEETETEEDPVEDEEPKTEESESTEDEEK